MEKIFHFHYGRDLEHDHIDQFIKEKLMPYRKLRHNRPNLNITYTPDFELVLDIFDINKEKHQDNKYYLEFFYLTTNQFALFEESYSKFGGFHTWCKPNHRGHYYIHIDNREYTARVYVTLDDRQIILIDDESIHNDELRRKVYRLPEELQVLILTPNERANERTSHRLVEDWIKRILLFQY